MRFELLLSLLGNPFLKCEAIVTSHSIKYLVKLIIIEEHTCVGLGFVELVHLGFYGSPSLVFFFFPVSWPQYLGTPQCANTSNDVDYTRASKVNITDVLEPACAPAGFCAVIEFVNCPHPCHHYWIDEASHEE